MCILVIEDHALVREGLLLATGDFDLVLLELMLPWTGSLAFLGFLRQRFPHLPVVILSVLDDADTVLKAIRLGAAGFVSKSSPTDILLGALREVLAEGKTNRDISKLLEVTEGTVKNHISSIFKALGASNRSQALLVAQGRK